MNSSVRNAVIAGGLVLSLVWASAGSAPPGARRPAVGKPGAAAAGKPTTTPAAAKKKAEEIPLAFNGVPVVQICKFLNEKKGKPVIPDESIKAKKITVVHTKKMPLEEALMILAEALRQSGIIIEESEHIIFLRPIKDAKKARLRVVGPEENVSAIKDKSMMVDKVFLIKHYDVLRLKDVIVPMLPAYGHITADSGTRKLVITETVGSLERIERIIANLDVETADETVKEIFKIKQGDASEIISILRPLIQGSVGKRPGSVSSSSGSSSVRVSGSSPSRSGSPRPPGSSGKPSPPGAPAGTASVVFVEGSKAPVMLMAEVSRNWIIAVAPPQVMKQIREWITRLDVAPEREKDFEMIPVQFVDIDEAAEQIMRTIESIPSEEFKKSIRVVPFLQARKLIVFGSERGRALVRELLEKIDDETSGAKITREFQLHYDDADKVAEKIDALFSGRRLSYRSFFGESYRYDSRAPKIKVVQDNRRNSITVITDAKTMEQVEKLIAEWDKPIAEGEVRPKVYLLKYQDPQEMKKLLTEMFTTSRRMEGPWYDSRVVESTPVGRLADQFSFQVLPNSNMLIVTSKNVANYAVTDALIKELDRPQEAGLPVIVELKYANAEDLAEQLNSLLSLPGTLAEITRVDRTFTTGKEKKRLSTSAGPSPSPSAPGGQRTPANRMPFWWQKEPHRPDTSPASNMVGKIRFVPVARRNALMALSPESYRQPIQELIERLDQPSMQVAIHAYIGEVEHDDVTTLGLRVAADPSILNDPRLFDSAISGGINAKYEGIFGGRGGTTTLSASVNVSVLLQLLMKTYDLNILFEPTLYTKDNQEAMFFDGQDVPVQASVKESAEGTSQTRSFEYTEVGTRLRIRPHITSDGLVDLKINLEVSRIVPGQSTLGNFIFDRRETTTHVVVDDGQWIMLSGIIRQEDFEEVRKVPLLGDLPLIGPLFRSIDKAKRNRELVAFIRPRVTYNPKETQSDSEEKLPVLRGLKKRLDDSLGAILLPVPVGKPAPAARPTTRPRPGGRPPEAAPKAALGAASAARGSEP